MARVKRDKNLPDSGRDWKREKDERKRKKSKNKRKKEKERKLIVKVYLCVTVRTAALVYTYI